MDFRRQWARLRRFWSGQPQPEHEERLMQLYWNRAELKKELATQIEHNNALAEKLRLQEAAIRRMLEQQEQLYAYLGNPELGANALVYFQLRALWKLGSEQVTKFATELRRQQEERERKRHREDCEARRNAEIAVLDERIRNAQSAAAMLHGRMQLLSQRRAELGRWWLLGLWNRSKRRQLAKEIARLLIEHKASLAQVADGTAERAYLAARPLPEFPGLSIEGRRLINTAVLAYAEFQIALLPHRSLARLAKDAVNVQVFDIKFGTRDECARLMTLAKTGLQALATGSQNVVLLKEFTDRLRARAQYRGMEDVVPTAESIAEPAITTSMGVASGDDVKAAPINVLVDDYWGVSASLIR